MMNATSPFDQVQTTYVYPARNASSSRPDNDVVVFLEKYYSLCLLIFGTVGNLLCLAVLSRETFRRSSAGIYLRFLTLSDLTAIYTGVLFFTARALFNNNFRKTDELSCKFHRWLSFTACDLSSWALVLVSTARLLSIAWPMKRLITRKRVYASILVTVVVLLGANLPIFIIYGDVRDPVRNRTSLCVFTQESYQDFYIYVFSWLVLVKFGFLPGVLLIVLNAALVFSVSRSGRALDQIMSQKSHPVTNSGPAVRNVKTRLTISKRKLEAEDSTSYTPDVDSCEMSAGSEFSDRSLSTSDGNVTNTENSRLVGAWSKILLHLKFKGSHESQGHRLYESSLRKLFYGLGMLMPHRDASESHRDASESHRDLVDVAEGEDSSSHKKQATVDNSPVYLHSESDNMCKETNLSWLEEGMKSGQGSLNDLAGTKTPDKEHRLTENKTSRADVPDVEKTYPGVNDLSDSHQTWPSGNKDRNTSVGIVEELLTDQALVVSDKHHSSTSSHPHDSHDENIDQHHHVNTTQPTTHYNTSVPSNNIWTLSENQFYLNNVNNEDNVTSIGKTNPLGRVTLMGLRDINVHEESQTSKENVSINHDRDIDMTMTNKIPSNDACVSVQKMSSHNHLDFIHNQRHQHQTGYDQLVCAYITSGKRGSPAESSGNSSVANKGSNSASVDSDSCPSNPAPRLTDPESITDSSQSERINPESITDSSQSERINPESITDSSQSERINPESITDSSQSERINPESITDSSQNERINPESTVDSTSQNNRTSTEPVHEGSRVDGLTQPAALSSRNGCRRKSGLPRKVANKVANKNRSLTRTLLVLNSVFLLCNTPITVYLTGKTYFWPDAVEYSDVQEVIVTVANFTMYTNNSINFILYCITGSRFRGQLVLMFKELYHLVRNCTRRLSPVCKQRI